MWERNINWQPFACAPNGRSSPDLDMCPDWGSNQQPFGWRRMLQPTEPCQPEPKSFFFFFFNVLNWEREERREKHWCVAPPTHAFIGSSCVPPDGGSSPQPLAYWQAALIIWATQTGSNTKPLMSPCTDNSYNQTTQWSIHCMAFKVLFQAHNVPNDWKYSTPFKNKKLRHWELKGTKGINLQL